MTTVTELKPVGIVPLDQAYLTSIFEALGKLEVQLDADPLVYGPKRLNQKTALARKMLTECERLFLDISQKHAYYKRAHRAASLILDMSLKHLLANDPETRAGRAVSEREATAYGKLKVEVREVADAQNALEELDAVMAVVKAKRSDLRDIQGRLRDQVRLCQEEIGLGNRWGSKSPRGVELQPGQGFADGDDTSAIDDVIASVRQADPEAEVHLKAEVDTEDNSEEAVAALQANADETGEEVEDPVPPATREEVEKPGTPSLQEEFGFVPHCEVCGEPQIKTTSGMVCSNGHGGAASVPPPGDALDEAVKDTSSATLLPGTADHDDVAAFLSDGPATATPPKKSRFQIEEEDGMDLDAILADFDK